MGDSMNPSENLDSPTVLLRRLHRWRMAFFGLMILIAGLTTGAAVTLLVVDWRGPDRPISGAGGDRIRARVGPPGDPRRRARQGRHRLRHPDRLAVQLAVQ